MKFAIVGHNTQRIIDVLNMFGHDIDNNRPDFIITYGGDGTILSAERRFPGMPKITLSGGDVGFKCMYSEFDLEDVIIRIEDEKYTLLEELKLETSFQGRNYLSLNEVQLHNYNPTKAVRFSVFVDSKVLYENVIGDGVVVATPFGSTAYFKSIGGIKFDKGIGIGLNNVCRYEHDKNTIYKYSIADINSKILVKILRDNGILLFDNDDNDDNMIKLKEGDQIIVKRAAETAKFVVI